MIFAILFGSLGIGMVLVIYGTIARNRWGINTDQVFCPRCKTPLPQIRKPQTLQQALWGGGTFCLRRERRQMGARIGIMTDSGSVSV
jgi:hypothetical protein